MITITDVVNKAAILFNQLLPVVMILAGLGLGFSLTKFIIQAIGLSLGEPVATDKRKNESLESDRSDEKPKRDVISEKPKRGVARVGDDGELIFEESDEDEGRYLRRIM